MKKCSILFLILLFISSTAIAQNESYFTWDYSQFMIDFKPIQYTPKMDVKQIDFTVSNKKGIVSTYQRLYNDSMKVISFSYSKKGKQKAKVENSYSNGKYLAKSKVFANAKLDYTLDYLRTESNKSSSQTKTMSNGKVKYKTEWDYTDGDCLEETRRFKSGDKLNAKTTYEYHSPCDLSKVKLFNGKGKLKKTWTYDCKQEGEELVQKKNVDQVCRWEESDGEYLLKVYQTFDEKGKLRKHVSKYTLKDTLIVESKTFNQDGIITWHATYDKSYKKPLESKRFSEKGKLRWSTKNEYQGGLLLTAQSFKKGKLRRTAVYEYNEDDLLVKYTSKDKKGNMTREVDLQYN